MMAKLLRMFTTYRPDRDAAERQRRDAAACAVEEKLDAEVTRAKRSAYALRLSLSDDALKIIANSRGHR